MKIISLTLDKSQLKTLESSLSSHTLRRDIPYSIFQVKLSDTTITAYKSGKVVFQGEGASFYARDYMPKVESEVFPQSGSDEVGTGSFFGPITVCACYIGGEDDLSKIPVQRIKDSKNLKDSEILEIAPILQEHLAHSLLVLDNTKYNEINKTMNMNAIKAMLHNQAFLHLSKKVNLTKNNIIDEFAKEATYYRYLTSIDTVFKDLHFETKAENKYISVACGSIIARYAFLKALDALSDHYHMHIPSGAGANVDVIGKEFIKKHGVEALDHVCKKNFANFKRILP